MERKIGEIFEVEGQWYQCVEQPEKYDKTVCNLCDFHGIGNCELDRCNGTYRSDKKSVIFKKLEKVGEPITICGKSYQRYKNFMLNSLTLCKYCIFYSNSGCTYKSAAVKCNNHDFYVEIKQNKEDMEEKKLNLREFDLEAAKAGKPVCTRDGRKARIICFDANGEYPLVAIIYLDNDAEDIKRYTIRGRYYGDSESNNDLMMLPEKKEGWVNLYRKDNHIITSKDVFCYEGGAIECVDDEGDGEYYISTIKISWEE